MTNPTIGGPAIPTPVDLMSDVFFKKTATLGGNKKWFGQCTSQKNKVCDLEILDSEFWELQNVHKSGVFTRFLVCSPLFWEEDSYFQVQPL